MSDPTPVDTGTTAPAPSPTPAPVPVSVPDPLPVLYTVNRVQDGEQVRADLPLEDAQSECNILNAQARQSVGQTLDGIAIYGSMINGEISRFEVRSANGIAVTG